MGAISFDIRLLVRISVSVDMMYGGESATNSISSQNFSDQKSPWNI